MRNEGHLEYVEEFFCFRPCMWVVPFVLRIWVPKCLSLYWIYPQCPEHFDLTSEHLINRDPTVGKERISMFWHQREGKKLLVNTALL